MKYLKYYLNNFILSIIAGFCIGIGCIIYLMIENKFIGAFLFTVGLFTILVFKFNLFTGIIGNLIENLYIKNWSYLNILLVIYVGNFIGASLTALLIKLTNLYPNIIIKCNNIADSKLNNTWYSLLILGIFCGMLMFIAVDTYKNSIRLNNSFLCCIIIIICVMTFILTGFEHSIADIFYFALSNKLIESLPSLILITIGNTIGGNIIPIINKIIEKDMID